MLIVQFVRVFLATDWIEVHLLQFVFQADVVELQPYDAKLMLAEKKNPVTLLLEGSHVGRGTKWWVHYRHLAKQQILLSYL